MVISLSCFCHVNMFWRFRASGIRELVLWVITFADNAINFTISIYRVALRLDYDWFDHEGKVMYKEFAVNFINSPPLCDALDAMELSCEGFLILILNLVLVRFRNPKDPGECAAGMSTARSCRLRSLPAAVPAAVFSFSNVIWPFHADGHQSLPSAPVSLCPTNCPVAAT